MFAKHLRQHLAAFAMLLCLAPLAAHALNIWEGAIMKFEAEDKASPPKTGGVLFVGSSSIVLWDLKQSFPTLEALNRGFGGSQVSDVNKYFDRVVKPYAPAAIVFYSGDNDLDIGGKSPEQVIADYKEFFGKIRAAFPAARIINFPIKPSVKRWHLYEQQKQVNAAVAGMLAEDKNAVYIDYIARFLGADGKPDPALLRADGLHMNEKGYAIWNELLAPHLGAGKP
jgi:lysophospholipase L1-like esterase